MGGSRAGREEGFAKIDEESRDFGELSCQETGKAVQCFVAMFASMKVEEGRFQKCSFPCGRGELPRRVAFSIPTFSELCFRVHNAQKFGASHMA